MSVGSSPAPETICKFSVNGSIMVSKTTGLGSNPRTCAKYRKKENNCKGKIIDIEEYKRRRI